MFRGAMPGLAPAQVSEQEFLALPESMDRLELLDGEVILAPSPSYWHQQLLRRVVRQLEDWAETCPEPVTVAMAPLDVRFAARRILQPDAFVHFGSIPRQHEGPLDIVPALCVEVLSTNRSYDRMTKRLVYAESGVQELWTVDLDAKAERWFGERLSLRACHNQELTTPLLPGFCLKLSELIL
jgi:Uma2 family endonuclease